MLKQQNGDSTRSYRTVTLSCLTCVFLLISETTYFTQRAGRLMYLFTVNPGNPPRLTLMACFTFGVVKTGNSYFHGSAQVILGFTLTSIIGNFVLFTCFGSDLNIHMIRFLFAINANDSMYFSKNVEKLAHSSNVLLSLCCITACILSYIGILYHPTVRSVVVKKSEPQ